MKILVDDEAHKGKLSALIASLGMTLDPKFYSLEIASDVFGKERAILLDELGRYGIDFKTDLVLISENARPLASEALQKIFETIRSGLESRFSVFRLAAQSA